MESILRLTPVGIATFFLVATIVIYSYTSMNPEVKLRGWKGNLSSTIYSFGLGISIMFVWQFCTSRGYPSRLDIYVLAASLYNVLTYGMACMTSALGFIKERKARLESDNK